MAPGEVIVSGPTVISERVVSVEDPQAPGHAVVGGEDTAGYAVANGQGPAAEPTPIGVARGATAAAAADPRMAQAMRRPAGGAYDPSVVPTSIPPAPAPMSGPGHNRPHVISHVLGLAEDRCPPRGAGRQAPAGARGDLLWRHEQGQRAAGFDGLRPSVIVGHELWRNIRSRPLAGAAGLSMQWKRSPGLCRGAACFLGRREELVRGPTGLGPMLRDKAESQCGIRRTPSLSRWARVAGDRTGGPPVMAGQIVSSARRKARARPSLARFETLQEGLTDAK